jgi:hypothetical protein
MKTFLQKSVKHLLLLEILMSKKVLNFNLKLSSIVKETHFHNFIGRTSRFIEKIARRSQKSRKISYIFLKFLFRLSQNQDPPKVRLIAVQLFVFSAKSRRQTLKIRGPSRNFLCLPGTFVHNACQRSLLGAVVSPQ